MKHERWRWLPPLWGESTMGERRIRRSYDQVRSCGGVEAGGTVCTRPKKKQQPSDWNEVAAAIHASHYMAGRDEGPSSWRERRRDADAHLSVVCSIYSYTYINTFVRVCVCVCDSKIWEKTRNAIITTEVEFAHIQIFIRYKIHKYETYKPHIFISTHQTNKYSNPIRLR